MNDEEKIKRKKKRKKRTDNVILAAVITHNKLGIQSMWPNLLEISRMQNQQICCCIHHVVCSLHTVSASTHFATCFLFFFIPFGNVQYPALNSVPSWWYFVATLCSSQLCMQHQFPYFAFDLFFVHLRLLFEIQTHQIQQFNAIYCDQFSMRKSGRIWNEISGRGVHYESGNFAFKLINWLEFQSSVQFRISHLTMLNSVDDCGLVCAAGMRDCSGKSCVDFHWLRN